MCDLGSITDAGGIWEGDPLRPSAAGQYIAILASANTWYRNEATKKIAMMAAG